MAGKKDRRILKSLIPLGLAKLFTDQAVPSAGLSGTLLVARALKRRGVSRDLTMTVLLHLFSVPLEAALASVLLLRGFTFWLPMIPGLWLARREML